MTADVATTVPVREFDVMTRAADEHVDDLEFERPGLIVESLLGRYVLDRDGSRVWFEIDGCRTGEEIAAAVAASTGCATSFVREPVLKFLADLDELGLIRVA